MLIEFKVSNFRSIGEEQVLSLVPATNQKEFPQNILGDDKNLALNVIAVYGANGSGKSNLLKAFQCFSEIVSNSARKSSVASLDFDPFLLREGWMNKPTRFEIVLVIFENRYRYGFEYNEHQILREWLFRKVIGREVSVFQREKDTIEVSSGLDANHKIVGTAIEATRDNALFLSTLDMFNVNEARNLIAEVDNLLYLDVSESKYRRQLEMLWKDPSIIGDIMSHMERLNLGFTELEAKEEEPHIVSQRKMPELNIYAKHRYYDQKSGKPTKESVSWNYFDRESSGSVKALEMSGPIILSLIVGGVLVIDELEAKMHPLLTLHTISLFLNKQTNPKGTQLIFATHDTNLLSYAEMRRDQIYFAEKNEWESTEIYSLSDFVYVNEQTGQESKERPDTDKEKRYMEGRYGAIPVLGHLAKLKQMKRG